MSKLIDRVWEAGRYIQKKREEAEAKIRELESDLLKSETLCSTQAIDIAELENKVERYERPLRIIAAYNMGCTVEAMNYHQKLAQAALDGTEGKGDV